MRPEVFDMVIVGLACFAAGAWLAAMMIACLNPPRIADSGPLVLPDETRKILLPQGGSGTAPAKVVPPPGGTGVVRPKWGPGPIRECQCSWCGVHDLRHVQAALCRLRAVTPTITEADQCPL